MVKSENAFCICSPKYTPNPGALSLLEKNYTCTDCDACDKKFPTKQKLKNHVRFVPLGARTDQTTEAAHQYMNKRMMRSQYRVKDKAMHMD